VVAEDHQTKNARSLSDRDGAVLLADRDVIEGLGAALDALLNDPQRTKTLRANLLQAARPEAAADVVRELEKLL
jgi:UDP-N-acetylglucosamine--N-acetylmuramyl-(pentapeptide) pyrophosphoryl-undecaprenol N-acetylglucosamine transferase